MGAGTTFKCTHCLSSLRMTVWTEIVLNHSKMSGHFHRVWDGPVAACVLCGGVYVLEAACLIPLRSSHLISFQGRAWGVWGSFSVRGLLVPWRCCWAIQQGCQFFHLADYYIALKREGFILAGCYIDCYRDISIFTGCYIDWEREGAVLPGAVILTVTEKICI